MRGSSSPLGLGLAAIFYVLGTMLLPGAATSTPVRLRRAFDGLGLGREPRLRRLAAAPAERRGRATCWPRVLIAAAGVSIVIVTVLRARPLRRAATVCGLGAILVIGGLSTVANLTSID